MPANLEKRKTNFLIKANEIHGDLYDYSKINYNNHSTKVEIICSNHGSFWQTPTNHLSGHGCKKCGILKRGKLKKLNDIIFKTRAKKTHNNKYDYSKVNYITTSTKVEIICPIHGSFYQRPYCHWTGSGCPSCGQELNKFNINNFITKAIAVHGDKYNYSKVMYNGSIEKVEIICPIHGSFWQMPYNHWQGQCCPRCSTGSFKKDKPAILYYIKDITTGLYKIGITNRTVKERFGSKIKKIEIIKTWLFQDGFDAEELEQFLHDELSDFQIINENFDDVGGKTEFFNKDVLNLDNK